MKKLITFLSLTFCLFAFASAQEISFESEEVDYGKIEKGSERVREFKFKNIGSAPLIISDAKGSCGCTVPTYPKEPIMPGQSDVIKVNYDTNRLGPFTKYVTLTTNSTTNTSTRLKISGEVMEKNTESIPSKSLEFNK